MSIDRTRVTVSAIRRQSSPAEQVASISSSRLLASICSRASEPPPAHVAGHGIGAAQARFRWSLASRTADLEAIQDGAAPHSG